MIPKLGRKRQADFCEFKASLVGIGRCRIARVSKHFQRKGVNSE